MGLKSTFKGCKEPQCDDLIVDKNIGTSYDTVRTVYDALPFLEEIEDDLNAIANTAENIEGWYLDVQGWWHDIGGTDGSGEVDGWRYEVREWHGEVDTWQQEVEVDKNASAQSASDAQDSENKAYAWAEENENVEVEVGEYSAKHWAAKAESSNTGDRGNVASGIQVQNRRDTATNLDAFTPAESEFLSATDVDEIRIGRASKQGGMRFTPNPKSSDIVITANQAAAIDPVDTGTIFTGQFLKITVNGTETSDYTVTSDYEITLTAGVFSDGDTLVAEQNGADVGRLFLDRTIIFTTKQELIDSTLLESGDMVRTLRWSDDSNSGGAFYDITDSFIGTPDGDVNFYVNGGVDLVAVQILDEYRIDVATCGVRCAGQDDTAILQRVLDYGQTYGIDITGAGETEISSEVIANEVNIYFSRLKVTLSDDFPDSKGFSFIGTKLGERRQFEIYADGNRDNQGVQSAIEVVRVNGVSNSLSEYFIRVVNCHTGYTITGATEKSRHVVHGYQCDLLCQLVDGTGGGDQTPDENHIQIYGSTCSRYFYQSGENSCSVHFMVEQQEIAQAPVWIAGTKITTISGQIRGTRGAVTVDNPLQRLILNGLMMQSTQSADADWLIDIKQADSIQGTLTGDNPGVGKLRVNSLESGGDLSIIDSGDPTTAIQLGDVSTCKRMNLHLNSNGAVLLQNSADCRVVCSKAPSSITTNGSSDWFIQVPQLFMDNDYPFTNGGSQSGMLEVLANMSTSEITAYSSPERSMRVAHCRNFQGRPAQYTALGASGWQTWDAIDVV